jgi:hypothetical protein
MIGAVGFLTTLAAVRPAAACVPLNDGAVLGIGAAAFLAPSEFGIAVRAATPVAANFMLGWSWQYPFSAAFEEQTTRHRVVVDIDLIPQSGGPSGRARLGYRYGRHHAFAGAGVGVDDAGVNLSPEVGLKFANLGKRDNDADPSLHLLARAEIAPESGHLRGATVLLGWNLF